MRPRRQFDVGSKLLLIILCSCISGIHNLKCRSQDGATDAELKRIVRSCMHRSGGSNAVGASSGSNNGETNYNTDECEGGSQCRRYDNEKKNFDTSYYNMDEGNQRSNNRDRAYENFGYRFQRSAKQSDMSNNQKNNTGESQCVAHCFFEKMNMVDNNGLPDRRKVSYMLTKDLRERDLRNFYMDTVQQCFRYLEKYRFNKCAHARELIKCMSEYAKAQCDDWDDFNSLLFN